MGGRKMNTENRSSWQNLPVQYKDPATGSILNGRLLKEYEIRDPDPANIPTDEVYEIESIAQPARNISASWSSTWCSVSMSGSLWAATETVTHSRKVWAMINVWLVLRTDWSFTYDVPMADIKVLADDIPL